MGTTRRVVSLSLLAALAAASPVVAPPASAQDAKKEVKEEKPKRKEEKKDPPKDGKDPPRETEKKTLGVGDEVKELSLDLAAGGSWTASSSRGKAVVLVFASEFSAESLEALKTLGSEKGKTAKAGASVVGVLRDADAEKGKKVAKDHGLTVTLALDPKRKAYDKLAKAGLPWTVVLDKAGKIVHSANGFDDEAVAKKIEELGKK